MFKKIYGILHLDALPMEKMKKGLKKQAKHFLKTKTERWDLILRSMGEIMACLTILFLISFCFNRYYPEKAKSFCAYMSYKLFFNPIIRCYLAGFIYLSFYALKGLQWLIPLIEKGNCIPKRLPLESEDYCPEPSFGTTIF